MLHRLFQRLRNKVRNVAVVPRRTAPLCLEPLERRDMLSATPFNLFSTQKIADALAGVR